MSNPSGTPTGQLWSGVNTGAAVRGVLIGQGTNPVAVVNPGTLGYVLTSNGADADPTWQASSGGSSGSGTVTSVALTMPATFAVAGSPVTTSGTLAVTYISESANTVFAGPTTGSSASPTFRALVTADLPAGTGTVTSVGLALPAIFSIAGSPITTSGTITGSFISESANTVFAGPATGSSASPTFRAMSTSDLPFTLPLSVPSGGTGVTTSTNHGVLLGQGTASVAATAVGSTGQFLMGNSAADPTFQAMTFGFNGYIDPPTNTTYPLAYSSSISCTISSINIKCTTGSCTASVTINGTVVTGLSGLTVSSANTSANASAANAVAVGDTIGLSVSNTSSISGLQFTVKATRP